jgi:histidine triad (HIT) family protein
MTDQCIFCRITGGQSPARVRYQDDQVVVIEDLAPQAPHHLLIIPRRHISTVLDLTGEDSRLVGHVYQVAGKLARELGFAEKGFRVVVNCNRDGGQTVWHLHFHLLAGRRLRWPPG